MAFGERKFREALEIRLDESQHYVDNIENILETIKDIKDETELKNCTEYYFRMMENHTTINEEQMISILTALKKQKEFVIETSPSEELNTKLSRMKKDSEVLSKFSIVETKKEDNDKIDGIRKGVTYIEYDNAGVKELYEVEYMDMLLKALSDFDMLKDKNSYEIMLLISNYCKKCNVINMYDEPTEVPTDNYNKELAKISDNKVKEVFKNYENAILKERVDFKEFVNKYKNGQDISYALNSNGERIYIIGEEKYKYVGEDRELKKLNKEGNDENDINVSNFNNERKAKGNLEEIELDNFKHIRDFFEKEEILIYIMKAMEYNIGISDKQNDFMALFITKCMEFKALDIPIPGHGLNRIFHSFMMNFGESKLKVMIDKPLPEQKKEHEHGRRLTLKPPKDGKLSSFEKAGFISVAIIIESSLIIGGIFAILALVKK